MDFRSAIRQRASRLSDARTGPVKREKLTLRDIQKKRFEADQDWNVFAMQYVEDRERYERKFDEISVLIGEKSQSLMEHRATMGSDEFERANKDLDYESSRAYEDLMFSEERHYCIGTETEPGAFYWWSRMDYWREMEANSGLDKWTQDADLNEMQHWFKVLWREDNPIHHAHEPALGKSFMMPGLTAPLPQSPTRRSSTVTISNKPTRMKTIKHTEPGIIQKPGEPKIKRGDTFAQAGQMFIVTKSSRRKKDGSRVVTLRRIEKTQ